MDDQSDGIKRDELLKLGGGGLLAAITALLGNAGAATAAYETATPKPKPKPTSKPKPCRKVVRSRGTNPIGLDLTFAAPADNEPKAGFTATPARKVVVTGDIDETKNAKIVYTLKNPHLKGWLPSDPGHDDDLDNYVYVAVWY